MSERELFLNWLYENTGYEHVYIRGEYETNGVFHNDVIQSLWDGWQASANRQGYKLVPVEPTEEMVDAGVEESDVDWKRLKFAYQAMIGAVE